jgi:hypothetical protein
VQDGGHQRRGAAQPPVVGGLGADVGEQVAEAVGDRAQPAAFAVVAEQDLGHGQADQLGVGELGSAAWAAAGLHQLVDGDVQCDDEVVEVGAHETPKVGSAVATPTLGGLVTAVTTRGAVP